MRVTTTFNYGDYTYNFGLDTEKLDRNYNDEPYGYWIAEERCGKIFEINIIKTHEVDGDFTNDGYVKCYDNLSDYLDDEPTETIDVTFIFLTD